MTDDSELDYIRTFLNKAHSNATTKHFSETRNVSSDKYNDDNRILVYPGELMSVDGVFYKTTVLL